MRTQEEINNGIDTLKRIKDSLPQFSMFGDPNHAIIDRQIEVLKGELKENDIDKCFVYEVQNAQVYDALLWLQGEDNDLLEF